MPQRFLKAPWFTDPDATDLVPQGDPETVVFLPGGPSLVGLCVKGLWIGPVMLGIREDAEGRPLSCAVTSDIELCITPSQSNPRRVVDSDIRKGVVED